MTQHYCLIYKKHLVPFEIEFVLRERAGLRLDWRCDKVA